MIPNVLNTILGIALVYCAILAPALMNATASLPAAGVGIIALGFWQGAAIDQMVLEHHSRRGAGAGHQAH